MKVLKIGLSDADKFLRSDYPNKLLKTVLPARSAYIDEHGSSVHHYLLDEIEGLLLFELKNMQDGNDADMGNAKRAAEITREVEQITNEMAKMRTDA